MQFLQEARFPQLRSLTSEQRTKLKASFVHFDDPSFCEWMRSLKVVPPQPSWCWRPPKGSWVHVPTRSLFFVKLVKPSLFAWFGEHNEILQMSPETLASVPPSHSFCSLKTSKKLQGAKKAFFWGVGWGGGRDDCDKEIFHNFRLRCYHRAIKGFLVIYIYTTCWLPSVLFNLFL